MEQEELVANSLVTTERTVSRFASKFSPSFSPSLGGGILVSQTGRTGTVSVRIKRKLVGFNPIEPTLRRPDSPRGCCAATLPLWVTGVGRANTARARILQLREKKRGERRGGMTRRLETKDGGRGVEIDGCTRRGWSRCRCA